MEYLDLLKIAESENVRVIDYKFKDNLKGLYYNNNIAIDNSNEMLIREKKCILAEELGHHFTATRAVLDMNDVTQLKIENKGREWACRTLLPVNKIMDACKDNNPRNLYELLEILDVPEEFFKISIDYYKRKYGICYKRGNYVLYFEPLGVMTIV